MVKINGHHFILILLFNLNQIIYLLLGMDVFGTIESEFYIIIFEFIQQNNNSEKQYVNI